MFEKLAAPMPDIAYLRASGLYHCGWLCDETSSQYSTL